MFEGPGLRNMDTGIMDFSSRVGSGKNIVFSSLGSHNHLATPQVISPLQLVSVLLMNYRRERPSESGWL